MNWYEKFNPVVRLGTWDENILKEQIHYEPLGLSPNDVVLDIGAHIGGFALYASSQGVSKITCYEPHHENFSLLELNIQKADIPSREIWNVAITDIIEGAFYIPLSGVNTGMGSLLKRPNFATKITSVNRYEFQRALLSKPTVIKCDIEGGELHLNWGVLKHHPQVNKIAIEYHFDLTQWRNGAMDIHKTLGEFGFKTNKKPDFSHAHQTVGIYYR